MSKPMSDRWIERKIAEYSHWQDADTKRVLRELLRVRAAIREHKQVSDDLPRDWDLYRTTLPEGEK